MTGTGRDGTGDTARDMAAAARHVYGPRPLGALLPAVTRTALRRRGPALGHLLADWPAIIGPALAAITTPRRLAAGTLTLACDGPVALEMQHLAPQIIERINVALGHHTVARLRFVRATPAAPAVTLPRPAPGATAAAARRLDDFPPGPLRDALLALGTVLLDPHAPATPDP